jgi:hypothetical protein
MGVLRYRNTTEMEFKRDSNTYSDSKKIHFKVCLRAMRMPDDNLGPTLQVWPVTQCLKTLTRPTPRIVNRKSPKISFQDISGLENDTCLGH